MKAGRMWTEFTDSTTPPWPGCPNLNICMRCGWSTLTGPIAPTWLPRAFSSSPFSPPCCCIRWEFQKQTESREKINCLVSVRGWSPYENLFCGFCNPTILLVILFHSREGIYSVVEHFDFTTTRFLWHNNSRLGCFRLEMPFTQNYRFCGQ